MLVYQKSLSHQRISLLQAIAQAANQILAAASPEDPPTVGEHWPQQWIETHSQFKVIKNKPIESECQQVMD